MKLTEGQVIRLIEYRDGKYHLVPDHKPVAMMLEAGELGRYPETRVLIKGSLTENEITEENGVLTMRLGPEDIVEVLEPEDWPEEVCVAVAKYQLTGDPR